MQPIPRNPMQGGFGQQMMGPGMFGGGRPMMGAGPGPFGGRNPMMGAGGSPFGGRNPMMGAGGSPFGGRNPMMGQMMGGMQQMNRGGGGLLSRLLGRGNQAGGGLGGLRGMQGAAQAATRGVGGGGGGGGLLQSLSNPGGITSFLNNTQQVLKTAQSFGPMIQQYGPIVKNLPAMWKLYRGLKNAPDAEEAKESGETSNKEVESNVKISNKKVSTNSSKKTIKRATPHKTVISKSIPNQKGASVPKLYI